MTAGFQPGKRGAVLRMASGGAFGFIKGLVSSGPPETVTQKYARQDAELAAKSRPAAAPATAAPAPAPNTIAGYASMSAMQRREKEAGLKNGGDLQTGQGGHVPGTGTGDKIPAKYEPGEFVVSNDMLAANPGMREQLHAVREQVLASQGKTPEQADARNAGVIAKLSAAKGFKPALAFASGGVVNDEEAQGAPADDEPPPQPPPLPPPAEPLPPISSIRGMQSRIPASGRPQTDLGFVNGGEVMRRAPSAHPTARGFKPALHFSTGGDDRKRNNFGDAAAATANPAVNQVPTGVPTAGPIASLGANVASSPVPSTSAAPVAQGPIAGLHSRAVPVAAAPGSGLGLAGNSFGDASAATSNPAVQKIPTGGTRPAPAADGSQNNPLNTELGRNAANTLSALPGAAGLGFRTGARAASGVASGALSTERVIPAAWEVVQEGGTLARTAGDATGAARLGLPGPIGQLAQTARSAGNPVPGVTQVLGGPGGQVARTAAQQPQGFAFARQASSPIAEIASPASEGAQAAGNAMRGFGRYAGGAAALGAAGALTGATQDDGAGAGAGRGTAARPDTLGNPGTIAEQAKAMSQATPVTATGASNPAPAATPPTTPSPSANPYASTGNVTRVGNSYSGGNVAGDITINGQAPRNGGVISQLNQNAAQALSDRYQAEAVRGFQPAGQAAPELTAQQQAGNFTPNNGQSTGGFGILDKNYLDKRNASVALSSKSYSKGDKEAAAAQIAAVDQRDTNATNNANAVTRQGMADQTARRGQDASFSSAMYTADAHAKSQQATNSVAQRRLGLDEQKAATDQAKESQIAGLRDTIINGSELQKKAAAVKLAAFMGKGLDSSGKPLNDTQSKALLFGSRMQASNEILDKLDQAGKKFSTPGANTRLAPLVNPLNSKEGQQLDQAKRDFLNAVLRRESGAVIADTEFDSGSKQYFPQIGDSPEVIAQKRDNRMLAQRGILAEVPDSESRVAQVRGTPAPGQPAASPAQAAPVPRKLIGGKNYENDGHGWYEVQ